MATSLALGKMSRQEFFFEYETVSMPLLNLSILPKTSNSEAAISSVKPDLMLVYHFALAW
jgi:hypothetical protein